MVTGTKTTVGVGVGAAVGTGVGVGVAAAPLVTKTLAHPTGGPLDACTLTVCVAGAEVVEGMVAVMENTGGLPELKPVPISTDPSRMT